MRLPERILSPLANFGFENLPWRPNLNSLSSFALANGDDSNGDAWTSSDTALYWVLGVMVALIIVGFIAVFGSPKSQQTARHLQNTQIVPGAQPGSMQGILGR